MYIINLLHFTQGCVYNIGVVAHAGVVLFSCLDHLLIARNVLKRVLFVTLQLQQSHSLNLHSWNVPLVYSEADLISVFGWTNIWFKFV